MELDVALVTPSGAPGVLDEPVLLTILGAVTNSEDGVIAVSSTLAGGQDTGLVGLECHLVGLNRDSERLLVEGGLHLRDVVWGDCEVVRDGDRRGVVLIVRAGASLLGGARFIAIDGL